MLGEHERRDGRFRCFTAFRLSLAGYLPSDSARCRGLPSANRHTCQETVTGPGPVEPARSSRLRNLLGPIG